MKKLLVAGTLAAVAGVAQAFCGFYVGKADANLFNEASQVIVVRDGDKTVVSMLNDYKGELKEFAIVVPVPAVLQKGQINVGEKRTFDRLDAYSAPRLAEYYDPNPCDRRMYEMMRKDAVAEVMVHPYRSKNPSEIARVKSLFSRAGFVSVIAHDAADFDLAAQCRAESRMRMMDALHYATALGAGCRFLLTNDHDFKAVGGLEVISIDSLLGR